MTTKQVITLCTLAAFIAIGFVFAVQHEKAKQPDKKIEFGEDHCKELHCSNESVATFRGLNPGRYKITYEAQWDGREWRLYPETASAPRVSIDTLRRAQ